MVPSQINSTSANKGVFSKESALHLYDLGVNFLFDLRRFEVSPAPLHRGVCVCVWGGMKSIMKYRSIFIYN